MTAHFNHRILRESELQELVLLFSMNQEERELMTFSDIERYYSLMSKYRQSKFYLRHNQGLENQRRFNFQKVRRYQLHWLRLLHHFIPNVRVEGYIGYAVTGVTHVTF